MGDYRDGKRGEIMAPVPGRPVYISSHPPPNPTLIQNINVDKDAVNAIANAVIDAIGNKKIISFENNKNKMDDFNAASSLEKIANAMVVQRDKSESNFDNLGEIKEIKRNKKDINKTIDLLSKLD